jgi:transcriptional regulator with XRE-family HTH domain
MAWQDLGRRIRALRERRGLTREQLAEQASLSVVYLKKLEAGDRRSPSFPALERIARALKATLHVQLVERRTRRKGGQ